jgi:hypothetical protein
MSLINFVRSTFIGPYPHFWEEKDLTSDGQGKPEYRYYLWVARKRFATPSLISSSISRKTFDALKEEWIKELTK